MKTTTKLRTSIPHYVASLLTAAIMLSGCAAVNDQINQIKHITTGDVTARSVLNAGIALYDKGEYAAAIKKLDNVDESWNAGKDVQLGALKYMAFSYCVTSQPVACRQQFDKALRLDPAFDLTPGEKGHPLWGPVFDRAKKQR